MLKTRDIIVVRHADHLLYDILQPKTTYWLMRFSAELYYVINSFTHYYRIKYCFRDCIQLIQNNILTQRIIPMPILGVWDTHDECTVVNMMFMDIIVTRLLCSRV